MPPLIAIKTSQLGNLELHAKQHKIHHVWAIIRSITRSTSTSIACCCAAFVPCGYAAGTEEREPEIQKKSGAAGDWLYSYGIYDAAKIELVRRAGQAEELHARSHVGVVFYGQR